MSYAQLGCRALLAVVFAVAVAGKARNRATVAAFAAGLADFPWIPARLRGPVAIATLAAESVTVTLLAGAARAGAALALGVLVLFTVATLAAGRAGDCHCFGSARVTSGSRRTFLGRNALLALVALAVVLLPGGPVAMAPGTVSLVAGVATGLVVTRWEDLAYLFRGPAAN
ncbi:MauE/DoxX family redox-associated membrane protein [Kitasatospora sp. NPDC085879]|uniref:MauE/DoxX family redox-associated membrane protein n=1 Tax=Kitasatospora sp. NPDC085879 TaxID=3154769 RepID=UPI00342A66E6